ncbi:hypothetical protein [Alkalihalobacillus sp. 1P02AB]|uniref:hypothetical protein n=1 Tax=Alkalihalobacillus sp. 1P02AB TaxID=3132260 RepID=UPI0039A68806
MNTFKGPFLILFEDLRFQIYIILLITFFLEVFMVGLGLLLNVDQFAAVVFGPIYGLFIIYPFILFNKSYKYTLAFGGTRKQFLFATYLNVGLFLLITMLILNGMYQLNQWVFDRGISSAQFIHAGWIHESTNAFLYIWTDILWGVFAFGLGFMMNSVWYYFGTVKALIVGTLLGLVLIGWGTFGDFSKIISFIVEHSLAFMNTVGGLGGLFLVISYFLMRNGPIERGGHGLSFREKRVLTSSEKK